MLANMAMICHDRLDLVGIGRESVVYRSGLVGCMLYNSWIMVGLRSGWLDNGWILVRFRRCIDVGIRRLKNFQIQPTHDVYPTLGSNVGTTSVQRLVSAG